MPVGTVTRFDNRNGHTLQELELQAGDAVTFEGIRVRYMNIANIPKDALGSLPLAQCAWKKISECIAGHSVIFLFTK